MKQDELERIELKKEQAALRIKLERAAMAGYNDDDKDVCESDPKAELGRKRKEIVNLQTTDQVVTGTKNEKDKLV